MYRFQDQLKVESSRSTNLLHMSACLSSARFLIEYIKFFTFSFCLCCCYTSRILYHIFVHDIQLKVLFTREQTTSSRFSCLLRDHFLTHPPKMRMFGWKITKNFISYLNTYKLSIWILKLKKKKMSFFHTIKIICKYKHEPKMTPVITLKVSLL